MYRDMKRRPLGPVLGVVGGSLALYSLRLPWLVIDPGGGFGQPIYASGWSSSAIAGCGVALLGLAVFSVRSTSSVRLLQIALALAVPTLALLTYSGPSMNALAEQTTTGDYFVLGWGPKVAAVAAVTALLGAIATASRLHPVGEAGTASATS
jgi:hypothetical protein